jgi:hypothetical protein
MSKRPVKRQAKRPKSTISIGGNVDTGGGDIAGGSIRKGDVYQSHGVQAPEIKAMFDEIYELIDQKITIPPEDREDLKANVEEIETETSKESAADQTFIERRLRNIARMAPDILDVTLKTISNPLVGLATLAQKISEKAKVETTKEAGSVKKNTRD